MRLQYLVDSMLKWLILELILQLLEINKVKGQDWTTCPDQKKEEFKRNECMHIIPGQPLHASAGAL